MNNFNIELGSKEQVALVRFIILAFVITYAVCPDLIPGPVDDIALALISVFVQNRISVRETE